MKPEATNSIRSGVLAELWKHGRVGLTGRQVLGALLAVVLVCGFSLATPQASAVEITIPRRSHLTPVQKLNRDGVKAVNKHDYKKAETLFLKAYLYDPSDPFTLNNLGYISELQGNLDRAEKFYKLAAEQQSGAEIALSSAKQLEGQPMDEALARLNNVPMRVNHLNLEAVELIRHGRNAQSVVLLNEALALEPGNAFTLNNLGVANEALGNFQQAIENYNAAAKSPQASGKIVLALDRKSEGKPIGEVAESSAQRLEARLKQTGTEQAEAAALSARGVAAANANDWDAARQDFLRAYSLDPGSGFAMNNRGYVAERDGDLETAQFFYDKARLAANAAARVGLATAESAEGEHIRAVAVSSSNKVGAELAAYSKNRREETGPIELVPRGAGAEPNQPGQVKPGPGGNPAKQGPAGQTSVSPDHAAQGASGQDPVTSSAASSTTSPGASQPGAAQPGASQPGAAQPSSPVKPQP